MSWIFFRGNKNEKEHADTAYRFPLNDGYPAQMMDNDGYPMGRMKPHHLQCSARMTLVPPQPGCIMGQQGGQHTAHLSDDHSPHGRHHSPVAGNPPRNAIRATPSHNSWKPGMSTPSMTSCFFSICLVTPGVYQWWFHQPKFKTKVPNMSLT